MVVGAFAALGTAIANGFRDTFHPSAEWAAGWLLIFESAPGVLFGGVDVINRDTNDAPNDACRLVRMFRLVSGIVPDSGPLHNPRNPKSPGDDEFNHYMDASTPDAHEPLTDNHVTGHILALANAAGGDITADSIAAEVPLIRSPNRGALRAPRSAEPHVPQVGRDEHQRVPARAGGPPQAGAAPARIRRRDGGPIPCSRDLRRRIPDPPAATRHYARLTYQRDGSAIQSWEMVLTGPMAGRVGRGLHAYGQPGDLSLPAWNRVAGPSPRPRRRARSAASSRRTRDGAGCFRRVLALFTRAPLRLDEASEGAPHRGPAAAGLGLPPRDWARPRPGKGGRGGPPRQPGDPRRRSPWSGRLWVSLQRQPVLSLRLSAPSAGAVRRSSSAA